MVYAQATVNIDNARHIGNQILDNMAELVSEYSFKRKNQAVTLASKSAVKIDGESIQVDPLFLFRLQIMAVNEDEVGRSFFTPHARFSSDEATRIDPSGLSRI